MSAVNFIYFFAETKKYTVARMFSCTVLSHQHVSVTLVTIFRVSYSKNTSDTLLPYDTLKMVKRLTVTCRCDKSNCIAEHFCNCAYVGLYRKYVHLNALYGTQNVSFYCLFNDAVCKCVIKSIERTTCTNLG